jgi:hypothetical protein
MDKHEKQMINAVNRNHDCKAFAERLNAISARRIKKGAKK